MNFKLSTLLVLATFFSVSTNTSVKALTLKFTTPTTMVEFVDTDGNDRITFEELSQGANANKLQQLENAGTTLAVANNMLPSQIASAFTIIKPNNGFTSILDLTNLEIKTNNNANSFPNRVDINFSHTFTDLQGQESIKVTAIDSIQGSFLPESGDTTLITFEGKTSGTTSSTVLVPIKPLFTQSKFRGMNYPSTTGGATGVDKRELFNRSNFILSGDIGLSMSNLNAGTKIKSARVSVAPEPLTIIASGLAVGLGALCQREYSKKRRKK